MRIRVDSIQIRILPFEKKLDSTFEKKKIQIWIRKSRKIRSRTLPYFYLIKFTFFLFIIFVFYYCGSGSDQNTGFTILAKCSKQEFKDNLDAGQKSLNHLLWSRIFRVKIARLMQLGPKTPEIKRCFIDHLKGFWTKNTSKSTIFLSILKISIPESESIQGSQVFTLIVLGRGQI